AENGLVGVTLFVLFLGGLTATLARRWRDVTPIARRWASASVAAGAVLIGQCTVDWLWDIPGLTGLAMLGLGLGAALIDLPDVARPPLRSSLRGARSAIPLAAAALLVTAIYMS